MAQEGVLEIYTDGSSYQGPRRGGVGFVYVFSPRDSDTDVVAEFCPPGYKGATNNQMELEACILALEHAMDTGLHFGFNRVSIRTDSMYVVENYKKAMFLWPKTRWFRQTGAPVLNAGQWKSLVSSIRKCGRRVEIEWLKGHSKSIHNKAVHRLAQRSAGGPLQAPLNLVQARKKRSAAGTEPHSVKMCGQRIAIRIVDAEYLRVQKLFRYRYEVVSKSSKYFDNVDIIYSTENMRAGHTYLVTVNRDNHNPMVVRLIREADVAREEEPQPAM
jgi:ribonuclease HI